MAQIALVTGAGSGIGAAVAHALMDEGWDCALVGRRADALAAVAAAHPARRTWCFGADLSDLKTLPERASDWLRQCGQLDALVNNAGQVIARPLQGTDLALLSQMFAINVEAPFLLTAALWPHFVAREKGVVVNVSTMSTLDPFAGLSAYAASKSALESLTRSIVVEGRAHGISAYNVAPGAVETQMLRSLFDQAQMPAAQALTPGAVAKMIVDCVVGRRREDIGQTLRLTLQA